MLFIGSIRERLFIVALDEDEYFQALDSSATLGIAGGGIGCSACKLRAEGHSESHLHLERKTLPAMRSGGR